MVIIDKKENIVYESVSQTDAARIVGVDRSTIYRWLIKGMDQKYHEFEIYFKTQNLRRKHISPAWRTRDYRRQ